MATESTDEQILKGLLDTLVLHALQAGPNYGFGIREQLDRQFGNDADIIKEATLYPLLHRLERKGLLASHHEPGERGSPRKYYRLTELGSQSYRSDRAEYLKFAQAVRLMLEDDENDEE